MDIDLLKTKAAQALIDLQCNPQAFLNQFDLSQDNIIDLNEPFIRNCVKRMSKAEHEDIVYAALATLACSAFSTGFLLADKLAKEKHGN